MLKHYNNNPSPFERLSAWMDMIERIGTRLLGSVVLWRMLLTAISIVTTAYGLMLLYDTFGSGDGNSTGFLKYSVPLGLAGTLHAIIFWSLDRWSSIGGRRFLALAVVLQIAAATASYGTHYIGMRGAAVTVGQYGQAINNAQRNMGVFAGSYNYLVEQAIDLAAHSEKQAKIERETGKSCAADVAPGPGDRYQLRMSDMSTFVGYRTKLESRRDTLKSLVAQVQQLATNSADEAVARRLELNRLVNEAKTFEHDPLLAELRKVAQNRLQIGSGPIVRPGRPAFTCYDQALDLRLRSVIEAIANIKPIQDPNFSDGRDPRVGFMIAMNRLGKAIFGNSFAPPSRPDLVKQRKKELANAESDPDAVTSEDLVPAAIAIAIEIALILLFMVGGSSHSTHPGLEGIEKDNRARRRRGVLYDLWKSLGGKGHPSTLLATLDRHAKHEGKNTLILVPLYREEPEMRVLHHLMCLLADPSRNLARLIYTGRRLSWLYAFGRSAEFKAYATNQGGIRVYRMSEADYRAVIRDLAGADDTQPDDRSADTHDEKSDSRVLLLGNSSKRAA